MKKHHLVARPASGRLIAATRPAPPWNGTTQPGIPNKKGRFPTFVDRTAAEFACTNPEGRFAPAGLEAVPMHKKLAGMP